MGDEKILPPPPPPPITGDVEALGPRTSRGRPTLPGGIGVTMDAPVTPPPVALRISRPPPLPPAGLAPSPFPRAPSAPAFDAGAPPEDSRDEGTPVPNTLPSASLDPNSLSAQLAPDGIPVVVMPTIAVGDAPLSPLPPPAILQEGLAGPEGDAPTSSRPPTSIAPAMPQIPKPVSYRPAALAPGIVSDHSSDIGATQAIPLTTPARSSLKGLILVTVAAAVIGGGIALAVLLSLRSKTPETAAAAPAATDEPSTSAAPATAAPATATPATATPTTTAAPAPSPVEPSSPASAAVSASPSGAASPSGTASPSRTGGKPAAGSTAPRPSRKSDRIED